MYKFTKVAALIAAMTILMSLGSCKKADISEQYAKEDAAGTGYGTAAKAALYIEDFYFLTVGTDKLSVELLAGSPHYHNNNSELSPVYTLQNGDSLALEYDSETKKIKEAKYTYLQTGDSDSFFNILVNIGIIDSPSQETPGSATTEIPDANDIVDLPSMLPSTDTPSITPPSQNNNQVTVFASGTYDIEKARSVLKSNMLRSDVISTLGSPNYFFSHNFASDSYIIDCYNLTDGSKLFVDYGYQRSNLRCAAVYKNGMYTNLLDSPWEMQQKPSGFTRSTCESTKVNQLKKNMTPIKVYTYLGEPAWYEGTRSSYTDVFVLSDGSLAYLNFGSAHNKLTSISVKGADGKITVVTLK